MILQECACLAYLSWIKVEKNNLDAKSRKYMFIGFQRGVKSYKIWGAEGSKVFISIDIFFDKVAC